MIGKRLQRGSTLLIALIILILLTMIALSAIIASSTSVQVVGNAQFKEEASHAAQSAIEAVISDNFTANPVASSPTVTVGPSSYKVTVEKPKCINSVAIANGDLAPTDPAYKSCLASDASQNTGILVVGGTTASASTQSWCYQQQWDVRATVNDTANTQANVAVHQGVSLKVPAGTECPN